MHGIFSEAESAGRLGVTHSQLAYPAIFLQALASGEL